MAVFVSYSSKDRAFVRRLTAELERHSIEVWVDERELRAGESLTAIGRAIAKAKFLVVVVSTAAANSFWVQQEIDLADETGVPVLPLLVEDVPLEWAPTLGEVAHVDFRRPAEYRRAAHRLICRLQGIPASGRFLHAKEAVLLVRREHAPAGDLFGISQQGVAILYTLANTRDWEFADTMDGTSRFWIAEFCLPSGGMESFAVIDGVVHPFPQTYRSDADPAPIADSVVTYSAAVNHLRRLPEEQIREILAEHGDATTKVSRRYVRFRPVPFTQRFVDSDVAVAAALEAGPEVPRGDDLMVMTRLERDKSAGLAPTWTVAFFDPTLTESVHAVAVDAVTGEVRSASARAELINAGFMTGRVLEDGTIRISMANQLRAMERHAWDIPDRLTARAALIKATDLLAEHHSDQRWQLAFLSNTGVTQQSFAPGLAGSASALASSAGWAGQWVVEVCGTEATQVSDGERSGFAYAYRKILCTAAGAAVDISQYDRLVLTAPLAHTPVPGLDQLVEALDKARETAIRQAQDFSALSVALVRTPPAASWHFRFYRGTELVTSVVVDFDGTRAVKT